MLPTQDLSLSGQESAFWYEDGGDHHLLGGSSLIANCKPHFHETYVIAYLKHGSPLVSTRGMTTRLPAGSVLFTNPYEIAACEVGEPFAYDVCYPSRRFVHEIARMLGHSEQMLPMMIPSLAPGPVAEQIGAVLAGFAAESRRSPASLEEDIMRVFAAHPSILRPSSVARREFNCVTRACELIEEQLDEPIAIGDLSNRVRASRSYFVRRFRDTTGLPPSDYIRQLRLARGLERIRDGLNLAEVANISGFADQAHFTREFKRIYGTTPGKLARDIRRCRTTACQGTPH